MHHITSVFFNNSYDHQAASKLNIYQYYYFLLYKQKFVYIYGVIFYKCSNIILFVLSQSLDYQGFISDLINISLQAGLGFDVVKPNPSPTLIFFILKHFHLLFPFFHPKFAYFHLKFAYFRLRFTYYHPQLAQIFHSSSLNPLHLLIVSNLMMVYTTSAYLFNFNNLNTYTLLKLIV